LYGGEATLGRALGPSFVEEGLQYQITENAVLRYDPSAPIGEKFGFAPTAIRLVNADAPLPILDQRGVTSFNGYVVYEEFMPSFERLGGLRFLGDPLTEVRVNREQNRVEQYFENLGLYRALSDPPGTVHLLPYGLMECHQRQNSAGCAPGQSFDAMPQNLPPEPFLALTERLGDSFTGSPLSPVYLASDGNLEQIYENIIVTAPPDNLRLMSLRALPQMAGVAPQAPAAPRNEPGFSFIPLRDGLGYNVSTAFIEYVARHGSNEISGPPTTELFEFTGLRRQCFTTYCLDFDPSAPIGAQIHPAALGYDYLRARTGLTPNLQLRIWEQNAYLAPGETQIISLLIYNQTPSQPLKDLQPTLTITLPDGSQQKLTFPPTSASGSSYIEWKGNNQKGGYSYQICVTWPGAEPACASEGWLVK